MRMPTKASTVLYCLAVLAGASMMTACSGGGLTGPQSGSSLRPGGRSQTGYVVAERDSVESLTRTVEGLVDLTLDATSEVTATPSTLNTLTKKLRP